MFKRTGKSQREAVLESGYGVAGEELAVEALTEFLRKRPALIEEWLLRSDNKRTSPGWCFTGHLVGHHPGGNEIRFTDVVETCALFIKREIEEIASH